MLHLGLGPHAHPGDGLPGRRPLGVVVRDGGKHVRIDHEAVAGQAAAERLDEGGGRDHAGTCPARASWISPGGSVSELITSMASLPPGTSTQVT